MLLIFSLVLKLLCLFFGGFYYDIVHVNILVQLIFLNSSFSAWGRICCRACPPNTRTTSYCPAIKCSAVCQIYAFCEGYSEVLPWCVVLLFLLLGILFQSLHDYMRVLVKFLKFFHLSFKFSNINYYSLICIVFIAGR